MIEPRTERVYGWVVMTFFQKNEKRAHYPRICNLIFVTKGKIRESYALSKPIYGSADLFALQIFLGGGMNKISFTTGAVFDLSSGRATY